MGSWEYGATVRGLTWDAPDGGVDGIKTSHGIWTKAYGLWTRDTLDRPVPPPILRKDALDSNYTYAPLEHDKRQIRVLCLYPDMPDEPLRGDLETVSLDAPDTGPIYEALSYLWGDHSATGIMMINGHAMFILESLHNALRRLRSTTEVRRLWADAICINQQDLEERGQQVQMMTTIYGSASQVVVWLGPASEDTAMSAIGMDILREFAEAKPFDSASWYRLPPRLVSAGLADIIQRPYFRRYWVVQESAMARRILMMCGPYEIAWANRCTTIVRFIKAIKLAATSPQWEQAGLREVDTDIILELLQMQLDTGPESATWRQRPKGPDLLDFAYSMRHRQASDPRDRIYSLIGLMGSEFSTRMEPDYTKTVEQAYQDLVAHISRQTEEICADLEAKNATIQDPRHDLKQLESSGPVDTVIERMCTQAIQNVHENEPWAAAQVLQNAAMLLRGESHKTQP